MDAYALNSIKRQNKMIVLTSRFSSPFIITTIFKVRTYIIYI